MSYFYNKKTSAIYVACVSVVERGGEGGGGGGKGMGIWEGKKGDTCYRVYEPPPPPHTHTHTHTHTIEKTETQYSLKL